MSPKCPHCQNKDESMISRVHVFSKAIAYYCEVCSKTFEVKDVTDEKSDVDREDIKEGM